MYLSRDEMGKITKSLFDKIEAIERLTTASKWKKMRHRPLHYFQAQFFRQILYPITRKGKMTTVNTFFDSPMKLQLPSAMDIHLWGAKTHHSEIRLAKFLIKHLKTGGEFMDIGVHFGFFSLLAAKLIGKNGVVTSIEASPEMFAIFQSNCKNESNITPLNIAAAAEKKMIDFFEFPILYSEYNTLFPDQYKGEQWYQKMNARKVSIQAFPIDEVIKAQQLNPQIIKIDVEGAELEVLQGLKYFLQNNSPTIVMEYLNQPSHQKAVQLAQSFGYKTHLINSQGDLQLIEDLPKFWKENNIDSDNIVLRP